MNAGDDTIKQEDSDLIERARSGDLSAFEQLFLQYRNQVFSLAYRMTGNPLDAEDVCQDVFLQAMRKMDTFQGRSAFSTWLYRVTVNRSKDHLRKKKRTPELLSHDGESPEPPAAESAGLSVTNDGPEREAVMSEARSIVEDALMRLPLSLRAPLVLYEVEGLEYSEISRVLRLPVGTVKSRIFRARVKLAEILEPHKEHWP